MVQKIELRIGNLLRPVTSLSALLVVTGITDKVVFFSDGSIYDFKDVQPVNLSQEFFVQTGFIYGRKYWRDQFFDVKQTVDEFGKESWDFKFTNQVLRSLKYIHQLQNIFYYLNDEELEIQIGNLALDFYNNKIY